MANFSWEERKRWIEELKNSEVPNLIIGGGVTGAALLRDFALRGEPAFLVEADDFASGTSSGSSKLVHGGLRYLENYEFKLVHEAIKERVALEKLYAPLVKPLSFVFPTREGEYPPRWKLNLGLWFYDGFSGFKARHQNLSKSEALQKFPYLKENHLTGACVYEDGFVEDHRLVVELIKAAVLEGARAVNRVKVTGIQSGKKSTVSFVDTWTGETGEFTAQRIFNASGPFSDEVRRFVSQNKKLRLTQGVHFVVPREICPVESAIVCPDPQSKRIMFIVPWKSITYFGTTDTDVDSVSKAKATRQDLHYLLGIINHHLEVKIKEEDILTSWVAVRPLLEPDPTLSNTEVSREHEIITGPDSVFHIMGGKLTSHRLMAKDALVKAGFSQESPADHLPLLKSPFVEEISIDDAVRFEMALSPEDYLRRRTTKWFEARDEKILHMAVSAWPFTVSSQHLERMNLQWQQDRTSFKQ